jgi:hypothetical protein
MVYVGGRDPGFFEYLEEMGKPRHSLSRPIAGPNRGLSNALTIVLSMKSLYYRVLQKSHNLSVSV